MNTTNFIQYVQDNFPAGSSVKWLHPTEGIREGTVDTVEPGFIDKCFAAFIVQKQGELVLSFLSKHRLFGDWTKPVIEDQYFDHRG